MGRFVIDGAQIAAKPRGKVPRGLNARRFVIDEALIVRRTELYRCRDGAGRGHAGDRMSRALSVRRCVIDEAQVACLNDLLAVDLAHVTGKPGVEFLTS